MRDTGDKTTTSQTYLSNYSFITGNEYYQRRKQPRQVKKFSEYSRESYSKFEKVEDSEEDIDHISNEEIKEHESQEAPFRQLVHKTKSTLQLLKLKSDRSPQVKMYIPELNTIRVENSLHSNYRDFQEYEKSEEFK